jgi:hypothetical protein
MPVVHIRVSFESLTENKLNIQTDGSATSVSMPVGNSHIFWSKIQDVLYVGLKFYKWSCALSSELIKRSRDPKHESVSYTYQTCQLYQHSDVVA